MSLILPKSVNRHKEEQVKKENNIDIKSVMPTKDLLMVERLDVDFSSGGIELPEDSGYRKGGYAKVRSVGPGKWSQDGTHRLPTVSQVGDVVLISPSVGTKPQIAPGKFLLFIRQDDVLATCVIDRTIEQIESEYNATLKKVDVLKKELEEKRISLSGH